MTTPTPPAPGVRRSDAAENIRWFLLSIGGGILYAALSVGLWILIGAKATPALISKLSIPAMLTPNIVTAIVEILVMIAITLIAFFGTKAAADDDIPGLGWFGFILGIIFAAILGITIF